jgi:hypothetical protein
MAKTRGLMSAATSNARALSGIGFYILDDVQFNFYILDDVQFIVLRTMSGISPLRPSPRTFVRTRGPSFGAFRRLKMPIRNVPCSPPKQVQPSGLILKHKQPFFPTLFPNLTFFQTMKTQHFILFSAQIRADT